MVGQIRTGLIAAAVAAALLVPASADAGWVIKGRGFGHGIGMSQYGAYGLARHGRSHKRILAHYYKNTKLGKARTRSVKVLITTGLGSLNFGGATKACGKNLNDNRTYTFDATGSKVVLRRNGRRIAGCGNEGSAAGGRSVRFEGVGNYRGQLRARNSGGALLAINKVGIEGYVRGVIPNEVPTSWPGAALRAQAIAARSYALATRLNGNGYDLYDDTRSQVYGGASSEVGSTNRASGATSKQVVKYRGDVAVTYFFSTSGGQTENVEFGFPGGSPSPYLKSVRDPFDGTSPYHKWTVRKSNSSMSSALSGLYSGRLRRIKIVKTGRSPRIVRARVVGSNGSSTVTGDTLRFRLGLRSTWATFKRN